MKKDVSSRNNMVAIDQTVSIDCMTKKQRIVGSVGENYHSLFYTIYGHIG